LNNLIDEEEKKIIESYENEEWISSGDELKEEIRQAAKNNIFEIRR